MESKRGVLMQRYELGKLLGQGTFAKVYHARNLKTGMSVAIKIIDKEKILKVGMADQIKREISVMRLVKHPNIVQLYEVMASKTKIYFVMEYVKGGELFNKVERGKLKEDVAGKYFQQLISTVDFCHTRGVYHRDLKPENLLLDEHGTLKISDFGLSALADSKRQDGLLHTTCGTPAYVAPEVINRKGYDGSKADIWSCGVIFFVLLAGYLPFRDSNLMEMYKKIGKAEFKCPNWFSPDARRLISKILDPNPRTRIPIPKIMQNSWFRKGFKAKAPRNDVMEGQEGIMVDSDAVLTSLSEKTKMATETKPANVVNAFEIISFSAGFDLSGLFEEKDEKKQVRFTSRQPAKAIIAKLEEIGNRLKMKLMEDGGVLRLQGFRIEAEMYEVTPTFHLVEIKKSSGDTLEYQKMMKQDIRPALEDIVWTWQGEQPRLQRRQLEQPELEPSFCNQAEEF